MYYSCSRSRGEVNPETILATRIRNAINPARFDLAQRSLLQHCAVLTSTGRVLLAMEKAKEGGLDLDTLLRVRPTLFYFLFVFMTKFSSKFIMYYPVRLRLLLQRRRHRHRHRHRHQHRQQRFPLRHHVQQRLHQRLQQRLLSGSHGPLGTKEQAVMRRTTGVTSLSQHVLRSSTTRRGCTPLPLASSDAHRRKRRNANAAAVRPTDGTQAAAGATTKSSARAEVMRRIGGKCNKLGRRDLRGHSTRILASGGWSSRGGRRHALRGRRRRGGAAHRRLKL